MTHWMVRLNPKNGDDLNDPAFIESKNFAEAAKVVGFEELNFVRYDGIDNPGRRQKFLELLMDQIEPNDFVVLPFPMWLSFEFQSEFIDQIKAKQNVKLVGLITNVMTWQNQEYDIINDFWLIQLRKFDLLVTANDQMTTRLKAEKVTVPMLSLPTWDYFYQGSLAKKELREELVTYSVNKEQVGIYEARSKQELFEASSIDEMISRLSGGFGLVETNSDLSNPQALAVYLAAGLPLATFADSPQSDWILAKGLGIVFQDLDDFEVQLLQMTAEDYQQMVENVRPFQRAVSEGFFTQRALLNSIRKVELGLNVEEARIEL